MRIWHRSATGVDGRAATFGDAQAEHDRRHRGVRLRRARRAPRRRGRSRRPRPHVVEELVERVVRLPTTVEPVPQRAESADELVAGVDRYEEALAAVARPRSARTRNASTSGSSVASSACPAVSSSHVSSGSSDSVAPAGLGIERAHPADARVHEEEGDAHRDLQRVPLRGGQLQLGERDVPLGHRLEVPAARARRG